MPKQVDLSSFVFKPSEIGYGKLKSRVRRFAWHFVSIIFESLPKSTVFKKPRVLVLKFFGAKFGKNPVIMRGVKISRPWKLKCGDNAWIGENAFIQNDNASIDIGNNVCVSQAALLLVGNHDYKKTSFDESSKPIILEDGVWVGARAVVCGGVTMASHSIAAVGSVITRNTEPYGIYQGNPAVKVRERVVELNIFMF
jgi:putative colanic acid biosynthesis acetyltransferase WcaF